MSKEGFFGPAAFFYHRHPPTGWSDFSGPLRPRAFDLNRLELDADTPWTAAEVLQNAHCRMRFWRTGRSMSRLARNADGDEILFVHAGHGELFCDFGHLSVQAGDYVVLPRGTMWRIDTAARFEALLIEATNDSFVLPDKGLVGNQAIFDPAMLDHPRMDAEFRAQQSDTRRGRSRSSDATRSR
jgi:homogentisate 1,2-dioxygenase